MPRRIRHSDGSVCGVTVEVCVASHEADWIHFNETSRRRIVESSPVVIEGQFRIPFAPRELETITKFSEAFRSILQQENIEPVRLPAQSPNLNSHIERYFRSLRSECLDRMIFFGEASLRNAL